MTLFYIYTLNISSFAR